MIAHPAQGRDVPPRDTAASSCHADLALVLVRVRHATAATAASSSSATAVCSTGPGFRTPGAVTDVRGEHGELFRQLRGTAMGARGPLPFGRAHQDFAIFTTFATVEFVNRHMAKNIIRALHLLKAGFDACIPNGAPISMKCASARLSPCKYAPGRSPKLALSANVRNQ